MAHFIGKNAPSLLGTKVVSRCHTGGKHIGDGSRYRGSRMPCSIFFDGTPQGFGTPLTYAVFVAARITAAVNQTHGTIVGQVISGRRREYGAAYYHINIDRPPVPEVGIDHPQA